MRYRWIEDGRDTAILEADREPVGRTDQRFWGRAPQLTVDGHPWAYRVEREGLIGALEGRDRLGIERGAIWQSTWRTAGIDGELSLTRTTSWLAGKLHFDVARDGERIAEVVPEGPWQYRPSLEVSGALAHAEAVFLMWAAARIDGPRLLRQISPGGGKSAPAA